MVCAGMVSIWVRRARVRLRSYSKKENKKEDWHLRVYVCILKSGRS